MRVSLRGVGWFLGGVGLLVAAVALALQFWRQNVSRDRDLMATFLTLGSELSSHYEELLKVETERPIPASSKILETRMWTEYAGKIAPWMTIPEFSMVSRHYADINTINDHVLNLQQHEDTVEELRQLMQACLERLPHVQVLVHRHAVRFAGSEILNK